jgi:hypothetical protein
MGAYVIVALVCFFLATGYTQGCTPGGGTIGDDDDGGGSKPAPTATPVPKTYWENRGGEYSYGTNCLNGGEIDPVSTVLRYSAMWEFEDHLIDHAGLDHDAGSNQRYRDNGACVEGELSLASAGGSQLCWLGICATDRWHVRCNIVSTFDPAGRYWSSCTPHRDTSDRAVYDGCGHVIREYIEIDGFSGSGFDVGRDYVWWELVHDDGHYFEGRQFWDNRLRIPKCNGEDPGLDGYVNVIWIGPRS